MFLNIKICFVFFVLDIYMIYMGSSQFLMPDGYDVLFDRKLFILYSSKFFL